MKQQQCLIEAENKSSIYILQKRRIFIALSSHVDTGALKGSTERRRLKRPFFDQIAHQYAKLLSWDSLGVTLLSSPICIVTLPSSLSNTNGCLSEWNAPHCQQQPGHRKRDNCSSTLPCLFLPRLHNNRLRQLSALVSRTSTQVCFDSDLHPINAPVKRTVCVIIRKI